MNKKAYIKNVIRTTLAEAYEKQAKVREMTIEPNGPLNATTFLPGLVTPMQKKILPIAGGLAGAYIGGTLGTMDALLKPKGLLSKKSRGASSLRGAAIGAGAGTGLGFLANYLGRKLREETIEGLAKEEIPSFKFTIAERQATV